MRKKPDEICKNVAPMHRVTPRYVRMVRDGERENEAILASVMDLTEGMKKLLAAVAKKATSTKKCTPCEYPLKKA